MHWQATNCPVGVSCGQQAIAPSRDSVLSNAWQARGLIVKKLLAGMALVALTAGSAWAADLPVKAPIYKAPPPVVVFSWTGFYVGANAGYSWGDWKPHSNFPIFDGAIGFFPPNTGFLDQWDCNSFGASLCGTRANVRGAVGGAQAGYNWQADKWLFGIEGDLQATGQKRAVDGTIFYTGISDPNCASGDPIRPCRITVANSWKLPWLGTFRGRVGLVSDRLLFYATGGLAVGEVQSRFAFTENVQTNVALATSDSVTKAGWTLGAGVEAALGNNWSVKAEYLYIDLGSRSLTAPNTTGIGNITIFGPAAVNQGFNIRDNIVRVGVNYLFNAGPVIAKY
jgi:outer membrane immunogenic protein